MANQYDTNLKLQAIADAIGDTSSSGLISALEDIADAVAGGGGGGSSTAGLVSDNFSETDTYDLGDYCIHNNTLYVCINAITTPGTWDLSDWQATNAGLELGSLNSALSNFFSVVTVAEVFTSSTSLAYTGKSITIPANTFYALSFSLAYLNSPPQEICISKSPTDIATYNVVGRSSSGATLPLVGITGGNSATFYIWAKYGGATSNRVGVSGVTRSLV